MLKIMLGIASAAVVTGSAFAADPAQVQDPPGTVDVYQPADVALDERNTAKDTTDTLRGARTEVIEAEPKPGAAGEGVQWREVEPGTEARASFDEPGSADAAATATETGTDRMPGSVYLDDTWIGTDLGYGTATEPVETPRR